MQPHRSPNALGPWKQRYQTLVAPIAEGGEGVSGEVADALIGFEQLQQAVYAWERANAEVAAGLDGGRGLRSLSLAEKIEALALDVAPWRMAAAQLLWTRHKRYVGDRIVRVLAVTEPYRPLSLVQAEIVCSIRDPLGAMDVALIWERMTSRRGRVPVVFGGELAGRMLAALAVDGETGVFEQADRMRGVAEGKAHPLPPPSGRGGSVGGAA